MSTSPFEQLPTRDTFSPGPTQPERRRSLRNTRPVETPSRYRTDRVDRLLDSYTENTPADAHEPSRARPLSLPLPTTSFYNPELEEEMSLDQQIAEAEVYDQYLRAEQKKQADALKHPYLSPRVVERSLRGKRAEELDRQRARAAYGERDTRPFTQRAADREAAERIAAQERDSLRVDAESLELQSARLAELRQQRAGQSAARVAQERADSIARHNARMEGAVTRRGMNDTFAQSTADQFSRNAAMKIEAEDRNASERRVDARTKNRERLMGAREDHAWKRAENGFKPNSGSSVTDAVYGFARAHNRDDFRERADAILLGRPLAMDDDRAPEITTTYEDIPEEPALDFGDMRTITESGAMRSANAPRAQARVERRPAPSAFTDLLDSIDREIGPKNSEGSSEVPFHATESMSVSEDLANEAAAYTKEHVQRRAVQKKQIDEIQFAKHTASSYKEDIQMIDKGIGEKADAFKKAFNIDISDAANGKLSLMQKAKLTLRRWTSDETNNPAALIDEYRKMNREALELSARLQEKQTEIRDLEIELQRLEAPINPNADHDRARARAERMTGDMQDRLSSRERAVPRALGLAADVDTGISFGSETSRGDEPSFEATAKNFEKAGYSTRDAREMAEELITGQKAHAAVEREALVKKSETIGDQPAARENEETFSFRAFRAFAELQSDSDNKLGKSFSRLRNLTMKDAKKIIAATIRAEQENQTTKLSEEAIDDMINAVSSKYEAMRRSEPDGAWKTTQPVDFFYAIDQKGKPFKISASSGR